MAKNKINLFLIILIPMLSLLAGFYYFFNSKNYNFKTSSYGELVIPLRKYENLDPNPHKLWTIVYYANDNSNLTETHKKLTNTLLALGKYKNQAQFKIKKNHNPKNKNYIYLFDPEYNLVLKYPPKEANEIKRLKGIVSDLKKLLRINQNRI